MNNKIICRAGRAAWMAAVLVWAVCGAAHAQRRNAVTKGESASVTFNFTDAETDWGITAGSGSNITVSKATEFTNADGYTITLYSAYYYAYGNCLMLYQKGAYLTLPQFDFEVSDITLYSTSGGGTSVTYNIYVGSTEVSTALTGASKASVAYSFEIDEAYRDVGTVYTLKVTNANNLQVARIIVSAAAVPDLELTLNENPDEPGTYYSTYSDTYDRQLLADDDAPQPYVLTTQTDDGDGSVSLLFEPVDATDGYYLLAAEQGYMFRGKSQSATLAHTTGVTAPDTNRLIANTAEQSFTDTNIYRLAYVSKYTQLSQGSYGIGLGFYALPADQTLAAGLAYIQLAESEANSLRMVFPDDEASGIESTPSARAALYDIHGRAVARPTKGLYISNGKKVLY